MVPSADKVPQIIAFAKKLDEEHSSTSEWILKEAHQLLALKPLIGKLMGHSIDEIEEGAEDLDESVSIEEEE